MSHEDPEVLQAIQEVVHADQVLKEYRDKIREIEKEQSRNRELLKEKFGNNTIIKTNIGNVVIRERHTQGKLSMEDIRDIFDLVDWLGVDTKEKLVMLMEKECSSRQKTTKTLTIRRKRHHHNNRTLKRNRSNKEE